MTEAFAMSWICPDCQRHNESAIPTDAEPGGTVDVVCAACRTPHEASVHFALTQAGAPKTIGVVCF